MNHADLLDRYLAEIQKLQETAKDKVLIARITGFLIRGLKAEAEALASVMYDRTEADKLIAAHQSDDGPGRRYAQRNDQSPRGPDGRVRLTERSNAIADYL